MKFHIFCVKIPVLFIYPNIILYCLDTKTVEPEVEHGPKLGIKIH